MNKSGRERDSMETPFDIERTRHVISHVGFFWRDEVEKIPANPAIYGAKLKIELRKIRFNHSNSRHF